LHDIWLDWLRQCLQPTVMTVVAHLLYLTCVCVWQRGDTVQFIVRTVQPTDSFSYQVHFDTARMGFIVTFCLHSSRCRLEVHRLSADNRYRPFDSRHPLIIYCLILFYFHCNYFFTLLRIYDAQIKLIHIPFEWMGNVFQ